MPRNKVKVLSNGGIQSAVKSLLSVGDAEGASAGSQEGRTVMPRSGAPWKLHMCFLTKQSARPSRTHTEAPARGAAAEAVKRFAGVGSKHRNQALYCLDDAEPTIQQVAEQAELSDRICSHSSASHARKGWKHFVL